MSKDKLLASASYIEEVFTSGDSRFTLRELSLAQRRAVLNASEENYPAEIIAALAVAFSCSEFNEDDVERIVEEMSPEILVAVSQRVLEMSQMVKGAKDSAKKPFAPSRKGALLSSWFLPWVTKRFKN
jgi:hypothetical protein